ncbi:MAG: biotin--[acetyl-CoA-carboxylase] ligase [Solirubrobacteraceae bacterium]|nr:biotin--[acetyl-CoA-carboxylase] ligase [Solirubrobacteraceae bacterium]
MSLGLPHLHLRSTGSTNDRLRDLAQAGAPHGTLVTTGEQTAGRGRQGRTWSAPASQALLMSVLLRDPPGLLPLRAAVAVAAALGPQASIKWPNDVLWPSRADEPPGKVAGILVEGRPRESWAIVGIGVNVALDPAALPSDARRGASSLGLQPAAVDDLRERVLRELERSLALSDSGTLEAWRRRDALIGREISWSGGTGTAAGVDYRGCLIVVRPDGARTILDAAEVHLGGPTRPTA